MRQVGVTRETTKNFYFGQRTKSLKRKRNGPYRLIPNLDTLNSGSHSCTYFSIVLYFSFS